jgi:hypothetical protein
MPIQKTRRGDTARDFADGRGEQDVMVGTTGIEPVTPDVEGYRLQRTNYLHQAG